MIFKLILSFVSILAGYGAFVTFLLMGNYQASIWAFMTGLTASLSLQIHWLKYKNRLSNYYTAYNLWSFAWIGFAMFACGLSAIIYNVIIQAIKHPPIVPVRNSTIISLVWCFLTAKTGALLFWYGRQYAHFVHTDREKLCDASQQSTSN